MKYNGTEEDKRLQENEMNSDPLYRLAYNRAQLDVIDIAKTLKQRASVYGLF